MSCRNYTFFRISYIFCLGPLIITLIFSLVCRVDTGLQAMMFFSIPISLSCSYFCIHPRFDFFVRVVSLAGAAVTNNLRVIQVI